MDDQTPLARAAESLGMQEVQFAAYVDQWSTTPQAACAKALMLVLIEDRIAEVTGKFRKVEPSGVSLLQGQWNGLEIAKAIIAGKLTQ